MYVFIGSNTFPYLDYPILTLPFLSLPFLTCDNQNHLRSIENADFYMYAERSWSVTRLTLADRTLYADCI